jgi:SOS-response transcriptional repressor LexA
VKKPGVPKGWEVTTIRARPYPITPRERAVLSFIFNATRDRGLPPSWEEVMAHVGHRSWKELVSDLKTLDEAGWIRRRSNAVTGVTILFTPDGKPFLGFNDRSGPKTRRREPGR